MVINSGMESAKNGNYAKNAGKGSMYKATPVLAKEKPLSRENNRNCSLTPPPPSF